MTYSAAATHSLPQLGQHLVNGLVIFRPAVDEHMRLFRDDIENTAALNGGHLAGPGLHRVQLNRHDGRGKHRRRFRRINPQMGTGAVTALAFDVDDYLSQGGMVYRRGQGTVGNVLDRTVMQSQDIVHPFQGAVLHDRQGAGADFLRRLE